MKGKMIEDMLLYKITGHISRIFVSSLLGNGLFMLLTLIQMPGRTMSILTIGLLYFCSLFISSYLIIVYLSEERHLLSKEGVKKWLMIHLFACIGILILVANLYYFLLVQRQFVFLPTLLFFALVLLHVYLGTLFDLYEKNNEKLIVLLKRNAWFLLKQRKIVLWYLVMLLFFFGIEQIDSWLLILFFPGIPFVLTAHIKTKEAEG
ncbi:hypothetical protein D920_02577 [Enterococcus faecalis 13-SD-W-01]|nr:hypothetical protein D920_02577 [Enterococcus faecalis 13-SD-W-01]